MTIKELYELAKEFDFENAKILIQNRSERSLLPGKTELSEFDVIFECGKATVSL